MFWVSENILLCYTIDSYLKDPAMFADKKDSQTLEIRILDICLRGIIFLSVSMEKLMSMADIYQDAVGWNELQNFNFHW